jgi:hypothetical protein
MPAPRLKLSCPPLSSNPTGDSFKAAEDTLGGEESVILASFKKPPAYLIDPRTSKRIGYWDMLTGVRTSSLSHWQSLVLAWQSFALAVLLHTGGLSAY